MHGNKQTTGLETMMIVIPQIVPASAEYWGSAMLLRSMHHSKGHVCSSRCIANILRYLPLHQILSAFSMLRMARH
jgi:hypothetical protein